MSPNTWLDNIYNTRFKGNSGVMSHETVGSWLPIVGWGGGGGGGWRRRKDSYLNVTGNFSSRLGVENLTLSVQDEVLITLPYL